MPDKPSVEVDLTLGKKQPRPPLVSSRVAVAGVALEHALGAAGRRLLQRGRGQAIIIEVPSTQWVEPMATCTRLLAGPNIEVVTKAKAGDVVSTLSNGGSVVGIAHDPDRSLPTPLVAVATHRFIIGPLAAFLLGAAMKRCLVGVAPASLRNLSVAGLDFDLLCALMPMGTKKSDAVTRIQAALEDKPAAVVHGLKLPKLEDAFEYGAAREWGLELAQDIADYRAGRIAWRDVPKGTLLQGPPGSGKTTLARILAEACNVPLLHGSVAEFFASTSGHLDRVIKAQRDLFARATAAAPSILFLDEVNQYPAPETLSGSRNRDYWMPVLADLFMLLDSALSDRDGVVVVGATNRAQDVAEALKRPGRLDKTVHIGPPSPTGLVNILRTHLEGHLDGVDLLPLAIAGEGATAAIGMEWVRSARRLARRAGRSIVLADLEAQVFSPDPRTQDELYRTAVHEAGHALIGQAMGFELVSVSIRRIGASGGRVTFAEETSPIFTQATMAGKVRMILAGRAAERIVCGDVSGGGGGGAESDLAQATAIVAAMRGSYGLRETLRWTGPPGEASDPLAFDLDFRRAVERDLKTYDRQTHAIARRYRDRICALATQLVELRQVDFHRPERSEARDPASIVSGSRTSLNTRRTTTGGRNHYGREGAVVVNPGDGRVKQHRVVREQRQNLLPGEVCRDDSPHRDKHEVVLEPGLPIICLTFASDATEFLRP